MSIDRVDLNLLVYLDALLKERNVTKAAHQLGLSQPAMSNGLRRLREVFEDPLLIRTSDGMTPTERAQELQPTIREVLATIDKAVQPKTEFDAMTSDRVFRIMASDYAEPTLIPPLVERLRKEAPGISLDIMTPSDVDFYDVEQGKVDMVINRFDSMPQSFHQKNLWGDRFVCLFSRNNPIIDNFNLETYLQAHHIWVNKTGMGAGVGINPKDVQRRGWVDNALFEIGKTRNIRVYTRHYQAAMQLASQQDLIVTIPYKATLLPVPTEEFVVMEAPFSIPEMTLSMAWSPLLQHNPAHRWMRGLITEIAHDIDKKGFTFSHQDSN
jgi:DNA-binding transcriptional LysR family regulator